jgi:hypothetical protein
VLLDVPCPREVFGRVNLYYVTINEDKCAACGDKPSIPALLGSEGSVSRT